MCIRDSHLKRAIERHIVYPLASLLATEQVSLGDVISIDWNGSETGLMFLKEAEGALIPMVSPASGLMSEAAAASSDGRSELFPAAAAAVDLNSIQRLAPVASRGLPIEKAKIDKDVYKRQPQKPPITVSVRIPPKI